MPNEYAQERREITAFFNKNQGHPAIAAGITFFQQWLQQVGTKEAPCGNLMLARLHHQMVDSKDILVEVMATWLFAERHPQALPDDRRLTFALARNAARLGGWQRKRYGSSQIGATKHQPQQEIRQTGERIRMVLSRFFVNLRDALKAEKVLELNLRGDLSRPF